jgi:putative flavoprotein involved in K+ transport
VAALERYQTKHDIQLIPNAKVMSVAFEGGRFAVHYQTSSGEPRIAEGSHVINGTGIISHPSLPTDFDPPLCSFRWMHSLNVRTDDLKSAGALLVVGGGQSATEVLERWLHVCDPNAKAWISMRSPMRAVPHRVLGIDFHYLIWLPEHLPSQLVGSFIARFREPMVGFSVSRAIRRGRILRLPAVATYHGSEVVFADGQSLQPDLVVFATGFQYAADHLGDLVARRPDGTLLVRNCESMRTRNLFVLGLRFGRTLASPYLRGIARDAKYVAALIAERGN